MTVIQKNATNLPTAARPGRAYAASLFEATAIARLAKAQGKSYGVGAIVLTHGESDAGNATYEADMLPAVADYNQDLPRDHRPDREDPDAGVAAELGAGGRRDRVVGVARAVAKAGVDHPGEIVCTGPKYQYAYASDNIAPHLNARSTSGWARSTAQVYFERVVLGDTTGSRCSRPASSAAAHVDHRALPRPGRRRWRGTRRCRCRTSRRSPSGRRGAASRSAAGRRASAITGVAIVGATPSRSPAATDLPAPAWWSATRRPPSGTPPAGRPRAGASCAIPIRSSAR